MAVITFPQSKQIKPVYGSGFSLAPWHPLNDGLIGLILGNEGSGEFHELLSRQLGVMIGPAYPPAWNRAKDEVCRAYAGSTNPSSTVLQRGDWCEPTKAITLALRWRMTGTDNWLPKLICKTYNDGAFPYMSYAFQTDPAYAGQSYIAATVNCAGNISTGNVDAGDVSSAPVVSGLSWYDGGPVSVWHNGVILDSSSNQAGTIDYDKTSTGNFIINGNHGSTPNLTAVLNGEVYWVQLWDRYLSEVEWKMLCQAPWGTWRNPRFILVEQAPGKAPLAFADGTFGIDESAMRAGTHIAVGSYGTW